jgi:platelet-activating factor acetylhydrolase
MIFSHGLGGSRNAYSHLLGSIASHGVVVIASEHRDGSTPITYIRSTASVPDTEKSCFGGSKKRVIQYNRMSHTPSPAVEAGRNAQLRIRLWELGLIHDSILKIDVGTKITNLNTDSAPLSMLANILDVHTAGKIIFAGHSFGAATVAQLIKSTYYAPQNSTAPPSYETLFSPSSRSSIVSQVTSRTPLVLLDMWCLPLRAKSTRWLWDQPLPCYAPGGSGGSSLLAVESHDFYKWRLHLKATKRFLGPNPSSDEYDFKNGEISEPNFFYVETSAHLSQSDFGLLFPWVIRKVFQAEEPERVMRLNIRAVLQLLRENSIPIAATSQADMEIDGDGDKVANVKESDGMEATGDRILERSSGDEGVRGWHWVDTDVTSLMDVDFKTAEEGKSGLEAQTIEAAEVVAVVGSELMKNAEGTAEVL